MNENKKLYSAKKRLKMRAFKERVAGWFRRNTCALTWITHSIILVAVIVLFVILIINLCNCNKTVIVERTLPAAVAEVPALENQVQVLDSAAPQEIMEIKEISTLPLKKRPSSPMPTEQIVRNGDIIVDGFIAREKIMRGTQVNGNVYLQNMRQYTLPCNLKVDGDLFVRDVALLKFCGAFQVSGNIYVNTHSSFGPIPQTSYLGGQIIL